MRRGELIALKWRNVDLARREIEIDAETEKTGRGRVIRLTGLMYELLVGLKRTRATLKIDGSDHVFINEAGRPVKGVTISRAVKTAVHGCEGVCASKRARVTFHTLRHTAASLMVQGGLPVYEVGKVLGHKTPGVTERYSHLDRDAGHNAIRILDEALALGRQRRHASGE